MGMRQALHVYLSVQYNQQLGSHCGEHIFISLRSLICVSTEISGRLGVGPPRGRAARGGAARGRGPPGGGAAQGEGRPGVVSLDPKNLNQHALKYQ